MDEIFEAFLLTFSKTSTPHVLFNSLLSAMDPALAIGWAAATLVASAVFGIDDKTRGHASLYLRLR